MRALQFATATANLASQNAFLFLATHGPIFIASSSSATLIRCGFQFFLESIFIDQATLNGTRPLEFTLRCQAGMWVPVLPLELLPRRAPPTHDVTHLRPSRAAATAARRAPQRAPCSHRPRYRLAKAVRARASRRRATRAAAHKRLGIDGTQ